ncbi:MAG: hypothetical protein KVP17_005074 [Porospora cf. gigantea B]|uniref:uncharacterized protein n=1 Tax=Porospora cf. gigantea B TaxID=2853592 RepID=UPI003571E287|nr:MAG: hypothetical protein KVP17_005074 [Porospora cf. gigantea B]
MTSKMMDTIPPRPSSEPEEGEVECYDLLMNKSYLHLALLRARSNRLDVDAVRTLKRFRKRHDALVRETEMDLWKLALAKAYIPNRRKSDRATEKRDQRERATAWLTSGCISGEYPPLSEDPSDRPSSGSLSCSLSSGRSTRRRRHHKRTSRRR